MYYIKSLHRQWSCLFFYPFFLLYHTLRTPREVLIVCFFFYIFTHHTLRENHSVAHKSHGVGLNISFLCVCVPALAIVSYICLHLIFQSISPSSTSVASFGTAGGASGSSSSSSSFMYNPSCSRGFIPLMLKLPRASKVLSGLISSTELSNCSGALDLSISRSSRNREFSLISTVFSICTKVKTCGGTF